MPGTPAGNPGTNGIPVARPGRAEAVSHALRLIPAGQPYAIDVGHETCGSDPGASEKNAPTQEEQDGGHLHGISDVSVWAAGNQTEGRVMAEGCPCRAPRIPAPR